jgi:glycosyltransferase involved in cell wall biosynthesis
MVYLAPVIEKTVPGNYVAYVGRITFEKGVDILCDAARISGLPVHVAGDISGWPELATLHSGSAAIVFRGVLQGGELEAFYRDARYLVVPSRWWEVCPIVVLEAMNYGCPVLAAEAGGLPELVDDGHTGVLFKRGDHVDLANKMRGLWDNESLRTRISAAARASVCARFSEHPYRADLLAIYQRAIAGNG